MWKAECQKMVPVIGSGKFITTPLIDDEGQPIDPSMVGVQTSDKKVVQWMQLLHQIGMYMLLHKYWMLFPFCLIRKFCFLGFTEPKS